MKKCVIWLIETECLVRVLGWGILLCGGVHGLAWDFEVLIDYRISDTRRLCPTLALSHLVIDFSVLHYPGANPKEEARAELRLRCCISPICKKEIIY